MTASSSRIPVSTFKAINGAFFGLAIVAAACRILIRLGIEKRLRLDDYLLLSSCLCLTASTGIIYYATPSNFFIAELIFNPAAIISKGFDEDYLLHEVNQFIRLNWTYLNLSWLTIFLVKYGFLALFKHLVDRLPRVYKFWKCVVIFTTVILAFAICGAFISCPKMGFAAEQCRSNAKYMEMSLAIGNTAIVLDMVTDMLIVAIPLWLLWRVRIKLSQKLGLGVFLCLSICMILVAITRVSGVRYHGKYDMIWLSMWQQIEACTAVTMLSVTAFRSLFVEAKPGPNKARSWVPSTARLLARRKHFASSDQRLDDLSVPSATLTGLSQVFRGKEATQTFDESFTSDTLTLPTKPRHERNWQF